MNLKYFLIGVSLILGINIGKADDIKTIEGEYTLIGDGRLSPSECKRIAAENARISALKNQFGTIVSQDLIQSDIMHNNSQQSNFFSLTSSEVKGEWISDIGEPEFKTTLDANDNLVVTCKIKGKAKKITNQAAEFEALILRNSTDKRNASTDFKDGDDLYLYFSAPINGYLSAYLADESGEVFCLLPYSSSDVDEIRTKKGFDYIFFDAQRGSDFGTIDELCLRAPEHDEFNKIYVIFSPINFSPAPVKFKVAGAPPSIDSDSFNSWLLKARRNDPKMGVKSMNISIKSPVYNINRF